MKEQRLLHMEGMLRSGIGDRVAIEAKDKNWHYQVQRHLKTPHIFSKADSKLNFSSLQHLLLGWLLAFF